MKKYNILITKAAYKDIDTTADYISESLKNPQSAGAFIDRIIDGIYSLSEFPNRNRTVSINRKNLGLRFLNVGNYVIVYGVNDVEKTVTVFRVVYSKRSFDEIVEL